MKEIPNMERVCRRPWECYVPPIKMAPHVWYVSGNDWVASYLVDTGDGLVLIDTAMHESLYLKTSASWTGIPTRSRSSCCPTPTTTISAEPGP